MNFDLNYESFYDLLKIDPRATIGEIVAAYHRAKSTFSKESMATYSLLTDEEMKQMLEKLDWAYQTLSNVEKRAEYDRILRLRSQNFPVPEQNKELQVVDNSTSPQNQSVAATGPNTEVIRDCYDGETLRMIRETRGWSCEDVSRITKIPLKFVQSLEDGAIAKLPARVYIQGFIKNLATLYRLDPNRVAKSYIEALDKKSQS